MRSVLSERWSIVREYQRRYEGKVEFFWQLDGAPPLNFVDMVFEDCPEDGVSIDLGELPLRVTPAWVIGWNSSM